MPQLTVIAVLFNPMRWRSRWNLFGAFVKQMAASGVALVIVECAFGDRPFLFTADGNWQHVRVRTWDELWIKENLFNLGVRRAETDYIAFLDGDIHFTCDDWAEETVEQLQHYMVVQPWSYAVNLGPNRDATTRHSSFCYDWVTKGSAMYKPDRIGYAPHIGPDFFWHPGLAWAWRREALDAVGGLLEVDILGGGDLHMAKCLIGQYGETFVNFGTSDPRDVAVGYRTAVSAWQDRCTAFIKKDIGYVDGTITHNWHGPVWARYYETKWKIVTSNKYDPLLHLQHSSQGVLEWTHQVTPQFRDDVRSYFRARNEDALS